MASDRLAIQDEIKSRLEGTTGVENVYIDYRRSEDIETFVSLYRTTDESAVQTWLIHRVATPLRSENTHSGRIAIGDIHYYHRFLVELFYAYKEDVSEAIFQALLDTVLDRFVDQRTLGGWSTPAPLALMSINGDELQGIVGQTATFEVTVIDPQRALTFT